MRRRAVLLLCACTLVGAPADAARPRAATLATFAGTWVGHTRFLTVTQAGVATERLGDGCCHPIVDLMYRLTRPRGTTTRATATMTVLAVVVHDPTAFTAAHPAPRRRQVATLTLRRGVVRDPLTNATYCGTSAAGRCGA